MCRSEEDKFLPVILYCTCSEMNLYLLNVAGEIFLMNIERLNLG